MKEIKPTIKKSIYLIDSEDHPDNIDVVIEGIFYCHIFLLSQHEVKHHFDFKAIKQTVTIERFRMKLARNLHTEMQCIS